MHRGGAWSAELGVLEMDRNQGGIPRWLHWAVSVGPSCVVAAVILILLPGLVVWAVTGDADFGRRLTRVLVGVGFGPVGVACGLFWFVFPYYSASFSVLVPPRETRCIAVAMGACLWGVGVGISAWALGAPGLLAVRLGLGAGLAGVLAGWLLTRWLARLAR